MSVARRELERLRYWQGQTLASRDFEDQLAHDASLRWWHNRAIHDAWGVVEGLAARLVRDEVVVTPGVAYDCFGRELILDRRRVVALPPSDPPEQAWLLVLRPCSQAPAPQPAVELVWVVAGPAFDPRHGVPLARGRHGDGGLRLERYELGATRSAGAVTRPRLATGATVRGRTDWRPWVATGSVARGLVGGIEVSVDTSAAGFEGVPCYFAWLQGPRMLSVSGTGFGSSVQALPQIGFERVIRPRADGFVFNLVFPPAPRFQLFSLSLVSLAVPAGPSGVATLQVARRELSVCWLGIESRETAVGASKLDVVLARQTNDRWER